MVLSEGKGAYVFVSFHLMAADDGRGFDSLRHIKRGVVITQVSSPGLSLWWKRVIAMAVFPLDFAVLAMDEELRSLVSANLPPCIDGLLLCVKMTAGPA